MFENKVCVRIRWEVSFQLDEGVLQLGDASREARLFVEVGPLLLGQVDVGEDGAGLVPLFVVGVLAGRLKDENHLNNGLLSFNLNTGG